MPMLRRMQRCAERPRLRGRFLLALLVVLLAQVLPCVVGTARAAPAPQAHCHDGTDSPRHSPTTVSTAVCSHCVLLATAPARDDAAAEPERPLGHDVQAPVPTGLSRWSPVSSRIDRAHPPPLPPLENILQHRVLLI